MGADRKGRKKRGAAFSRLTLAGLLREKRRKGGKNPLKKGGGAKKEGRQISQSDWRYPQKRGPPH